MIRDANEDDAAALAAIYNPYITDLPVSFEHDPLSADTMAARVRAVTATYPWLVFETGGSVVGYAYATRWKERHAYRYCVELCVYVALGQSGQGIGSRLYAELLPRLQARDLAVAIACIALPNAASVALHEKFGFEKVGHFPGVGYKFERWIDVGYWQKRL